MALPPTLDDENLFKFRTKICERYVKQGRCDFADKCQYSHDLRWTRRPPWKYTYSPELCADMEFRKDGRGRTIVKSNCQKHRNCRFSHTKEEQMYHPKIYKTLYCNQFMKDEWCERYYCPFAHGEAELRPGDLFYASNKILKNIDDQESLCPDIYLPSDKPHPKLRTKFMAIMGGQALPQTGGISTENAADPSASNNANNNTNTSSSSTTDQQKMQQKNYANFPWKNFHSNAPYLEFISSHTPTSVRSDTNSSEKCAMNWEENNLNNDAPMYTDGEEVYNINNNNRNMQMASRGGAGGGGGTGSAMGVAGVQKMYTRYNATEESAGGNLGANKQRNKKNMPANDNNNTQLNYPVSFSGAPSQTQNNNNTNFTSYIDIQNNMQLTSITNNMKADNTTLPGRQLHPPTHAYTNVSTSHTNVNTSNAGNNDSALSIQGLSNNNIPTSSSSSSSSSSLNLPNATSVNAANTHTRHPPTHRHPPLSSIKNHFSLPNTSAVINNNQQSFSAVPLFPHTNFAPPNAKFPPPPPPPPSGNITNSRKNSMHNNNYNTSTMNYNNNNNNNNNTNIVPTNLNSQLRNNNNTYGVLTQPPPPSNNIQQTQRNNNNNSNVSNIASNINNNKDTFVQQKQQQRPFSSNFNFSAQQMNTDNTNSNNNMGNLQNKNVNTTNIKNNNNSNNNNVTHVSSFSSLRCPSPINAPIQSSNNTTSFSSVSANVIQLTPFIEYLSIPIGACRDDPSIVVYMGVYTHQDGRREAVVIKEMPVILPKKMSHMLNELEKFINLDALHLVNIKYLQLLPAGVGDGCTLWLVLDKCEGAFDDIVNISELSQKSLKGSIPPAGMIEVLDHIVLGVHTLHSMGVAHMRIHPWNIMLEEQFNIKLGDMAGKLRYMTLFSLLYAGLQGACKAKLLLNMILDNPGELIWMAPELIRGFSMFYNSMNDLIDKCVLLNDEQKQKELFANLADNSKWNIDMLQKADVWSTGAVLFYIVSGGRHPFGCLSNPTEILENIINNNLVNVNLIEDSPLVCDLLRSMLDVNPCSRISLLQSICHPLYWKFSDSERFLKAVLNLMEAPSVNSTKIIEQAEFAAQLSDRSHWVNTLRQIQGMPYIETLLNGYLRSPKCSRVFRDGCIHQTMLGILLFLAKYTTDETQPQHERRMNVTRLLLFQPEVLLRSVKAFLYPRIRKDSFTCKVEGIEKNRLENIDLYSPLEKRSVNTPTSPVTFSGGKSNETSTSSTCYENFVSTNNTRLNKKNEQNTDANYTSDNAAAFNPPDSFSTNISPASNASSSSSSSSHAKTQQNVTSSSTKHENKNAAASSKNSNRQVTAHGGPADGGDTSKSKKNKNEESSESATSAAEKEKSVKTTEKNVENKKKTEGENETKEKNATVSGSNPCTKNEKTGKKGNEKKTGGTEDNNEEKTKKAGKKEKHTKKGNGGDEAENETRQNETKGESSCPSATNEQQEKTGKVEDNSSCAREVQTEARENNAVVGDTGSEKENISNDSNAKQTKLVKKSSESSVGMNGGKAGSFEIASSSGCEKGGETNDSSSCVMRTSTTAKSEEPKKDVTTANCRTSNGATEKKNEGDEKRAEEGKKEELEASHSAVQTSSLGAGGIAGSTNEDSNADRMTGIGSCITQ